MELELSHQNHNLLYFLIHNLGLLKQYAQHGTSPIGFYIACINNPEHESFRNTIHRTSCALQCVQHTSSLFYDHSIQETSQQVHAVAHTKDLLQQGHILGKHALGHASNTLLTGVLAVPEILRFDKWYPGNSVEFFNKNYKTMTNEFDKDWKLASEGNLYKNQEQKKTDTTSNKPNSSQQDYAELLLADEHGKTGLSAASSPSMHRKFMTNSRPEYMDYLYPHSPPPPDHLRPDKPMFSKNSRFNSINNALTRLKQKLSGQKGK